MLDSLEEVLPIRLISLLVLEFPKSFYFEVWYSINSGICLFLARDLNENGIIWILILDPKNGFECELIYVNGCRRGISSFYGGKSKSFTSLAEASSTSSIKDIAKQENAYTRRRRNLLAINHVRDKSRSNGCGISKRPIISSRSTLALAVGLSSSESIASTSDDSASRSPPQLPPRHRGPQSRGSSRRSYSVVDLQRCTTDVASNSFWCLASEKTDICTGENGVYWKSLWMHGVCSCSSLR